MVCYVTNRDYFPPLFHPDIDVNLCTHLIYAFASLIENTISVETTADTQGNVTQVRQEDDNSFSEFVLCEVFQCTCIRGTV